MSSVAILGGMALLVPPLAAFVGVLGYWLAKGTRPRLSVRRRLSLTVFPLVSWLVALGVWLTGQSALDAISLSLATSGCVAGVLAIARPPAGAETRS